MPTPIHTPQTCATIASSRLHHGLGLAVLTRLETLKRHALSVWRFSFFTL